MNEVPKQPAARLTELLNAEKPDPEAIRLAIDDMVYEVACNSWWRGYEFAKGKYKVKR